MNRFSINCSARVIFPLVIYLLSLPRGDLYGQQVFSLKDAISSGLNNHYGIQVAKNERDIAARNVSLGNAGMLPGISAYATYDHASYDAKVKTATGGELETKSAPATLFTAGVMAQWTLFDGTAMFIEHEKLKNLSVMSDIELRYTLEEAVYSITAAYLDIIRQQQRYKASRKNLEISNDRVALATLRYNSGSGSEQELIQARVTRQADTTLVTRQWYNVKKARILLNQLLAANLDEEVRVEDTISLIEIPALDKLTRAIENNSLILLSTHQSRISGLDIQSLKAKQYPRLTLKGVYGLYENESDAGFINFNRTVGPQIGLSAGINLFDGLTLRNKIKNARENLENEQIRHKEMEQIILAAVMNAWYEHYSLLQQVRLGKEGLMMADRNLLIARDAYQSGSISSLQFREAQDDLYKATSDLYDALYQTRVKETELLMLSGMLVSGN
ncbi:MAG: TolC family protein [Bacteroidales bacterium]